MPRALTPRRNIVSLYFCIYNSLLFILRNPLPSSNTHTHTQFKKSNIFNGALVVLERLRHARSRPDGMVPPYTCLYTTHHFWFSSRVPLSLKKHARTHTFETVGHIRWSPSCSRTPMPRALALRWNRAFFHICINTTQYVWWSITFAPKNWGWRRGRYNHFSWVFWALRQQ